MYTPFALITYSKTENERFMDLIEEGSMKLQEGNRNGKICWDSSNSYMKNCALPLWFVVLIRCGNKRIYTTEYMGGWVNGSTT